MARRAAGGRFSREVSRRCCRRGKREKRGFFGAEGKSSRMRRSILRNFFPVRNVDDYLVNSPDLYEVMLAILGRILTYKLTLSTQFLL